MRYLLFFKFLILPLLFGCVNEPKRGGAFDLPVIHRYNCNVNNPENPCSERNDAEVDWYNKYTDIESEISHILAISSFCRRPVSHWNLDEKKLKKIEKENSDLFFEKLFPLFFKEKKIGKKEFSKKFKRYKLMSEMRHRHIRFKAINMIGEEGLKNYNCNTPVDFYLKEFNLYKYK